MVLTQVPAGKYWDEMTVIAKLDELRWQQENSRGPSFETISAFGINAALPHYESSNATNLQLTTNGLFMVDSGGQYYGKLKGLGPGGVGVDIVTRLAVEPRSPR